MATETQTTFVEALVSPEVRQIIGARHASRFTRTVNRVQWMIARPPFVRDTGMCFLAITRQADGCSISIGRKGMCADIYEEARATGIADEDVDQVVRRLWSTGR